MTREEAIARIKNHKIAHKMNEPRAIYISEALDMAIKALETESCDDAISRQAYIERYRKWAYSEFGEKVGNGALAIRVAMSLPPVTPQPKIGHWIEHEWADEIDGRLISNFECSCCHTWKRDASSYCPECGATMKSEDKE